MAQLDWSNMGVTDTSSYLEAIRRAQQQSTEGLQQVGNAYQGYYNDLKKQNTNEMLTALNQARNPEELAAAQQQVAALQQRYGNGYDMDQVRTAMDERPDVLMQRQLSQMNYNDKRNELSARPEMAAIQRAQLVAQGADANTLASFDALSGRGIDTSAVANGMGQFLTNERNYKNDNYWKKLNYDRGIVESDRNYELQVNSQNMQGQRQAWEMGKDAYAADQATGATVVGPDGTVYSGGGTGAAKMAQYASMFSPEAAGMIHVESKGNPNAVSPAGAQGIIQIMPATAKNPGYGMQPIDLKNSTPEQQIAWAMEYKKRVQQTHGFTPDQATAAYNAGAGKVQQAIKKGGSNWLQHLPAETRAYVPKVNAATANFSNGGFGGNAQVRGISQATQQKIRASYQNDMLEYNQKLATKDAPVNVGAVLADITAKEKGSWKNQDGFDIANAIKDNPKLAGLSEEGIRNVYNQTKSWQNKPGTPFVGYNSTAGMQKQVDIYINAELKLDKQRKAHEAKASHPSNKYTQQIQQEFEKVGVSISAKEALLHIDPQRYESLYGKPTAKQAKVAEKKVQEAAQKAQVKATTPTTVQAAAKAPATKPAQKSMTFDEAKAYYIKRGGVDNVIPDNLTKSNFRAWSSRLRKEVDEATTKQDSKKAATLAIDKAKKAAEYEAARKRKVPTQAKPVSVQAKPKSDMWAANVNPMQRKVLEDLRKR